MYRFTIYELADTRMDFSHYVEVSTDYFETEEEGMQFVEPYIGEYGYSVSIEDPHGTVTYL